MRNISSYNDYNGWLDKYDSDGNYVETKAFKFDIVRARTTTIDPMMGTPTKKGEHLIKTSDPINPVTRQDKVRVEWTDRAYVVGEQTNQKKKGDRTGRRGNLKLTREFYIE